MREVIELEADVLPAAMSTAVRLTQLAPQAVEGTKMAVNRLLAMASGAVLPLSLALEVAAMTRHQSARYDAATSLSASTFTLIAVSFRSSGP